MRAARRLEEYFECQIRRFCDERGLDPSEQRDNRELDWIGRQPNGVTAAELFRRFRRTYRSSDQAAVRLAELERRGLLVQAASDGQSKLGRPTVRYVMQSTPHAAVMPRLAAV